MSFGHRPQGSVTILGRRFPTPAVGLAIAVFATSIVGALWPTLRAMTLLVPALVWEGELWRLATWALIEANPLSLVFAALMILWIGSDLARAWGTRRFLLVCLGLAVVPGLLTCLIARLFSWSLLLRLPIYSTWAVVEGLMIAWALLFPTRQIFIYLVLPLNGRRLIVATVALTTLYAVFSGEAWPFFLPHFFAQALVLVAMDRLMIVRRLWLKVRLAAYERELRRRAGHLRVVPRRRPEDDDRPRWVN
jgi:membrane associated rhomboid family serine protease